jgi:hypothetical protein
MRVDATCETVPLQCGNLMHIRETLDMSLVCGGIGQARHIEATDALEEIHQALTDLRRRYSSQDPRLIPRKSKL